jgi:urease accessory protein
MVALAAKPHIAVAAILVGAFAIFHGHAHGTELPDGANALGYALGFVIATGLLHLAGIAFGMLTQHPAGRVAVRAAGSAIAIAGLVFLGRLI